MVECSLTPVREFSAPLTIGVLADTHIWATGNRQFPPQVLSLFERLEVGLILHAGDVNDVSVLEELAVVAPVIAVYGNNDDRRLKIALELKEVVQIGSSRIGVIHGHGGRSARDVAFGAFPEGVDLVVYGHSHIPRIEQVDKTLYVNPGSPTDRRWSPHFGVGVIRCDESGLRPELILFSRVSDLDAGTAIHVSA